MAYKITKEVFEQIHGYIVNGYERMVQQEGKENLRTLPSKKFYHDIIMANKTALETIGSSLQIAARFLDELREPLKIKDIQNRFLSWPGFGTKLFFELVDQKIAEKSALDPNFNLPLAEQVRNDMHNIKTVRDRFLNDAEYRQMFLDLWYAGSNNNWQLYHELISPEDEAEFDKMIALIK